ncbi:transglutaminase-like putative cysteine protease [Lewinella marina]|uniref:DUF3857 domain-containing protein n=1 Tax=Neolewinella marina TaxID=438751 RepID=A0A2G0CIE4_9BACT|nr:DUF3857 domain-containing protein [Neolewinella marina]NJB85124.1 transglutaminase-like putative cysteine protease [Neolewinella marina]PHK99739.1 hypothetical protein CGL56_01435 [Neolewinella marina]
MLFRLLRFLPALLFSTLIFAQDYGDVKFGKLSAEDLAATPGGADSAAAAYILYDRLDLKFVYLRDKGPSTVEEFHTRMKLITPASFDRANVSLRYNREFEDISGLKAMIYLPDGEKIKLSGKDFVRERDGDYNTVKFTFPQVTPGAVIEYTFSHRSEHIVIPTRFAFQRDVPVRWAEYTALIPDYYRYVSLGIAGNYVVNEVETTRHPWGPVFRKAPTAHEHVPHKNIRWAMQDVPAFEHQPYTNNATDYLPRVRLQLQSVNYPGELIQPVFSDWNETVNNLTERRDFGLAYLNRTNYKHLWNAAEAEINQAKDTRARIDAAYHYVCRNLRWNGSTSIFGTDSPNNILENGEGNSADLNLALLALLHEAGIPAYPLLVSLRDQGSPMEIYPILTQFDHLLVYTEVDGKPYLLDANGPGRPPGLPREKALNHRGWVADPQQPRWVDVEVPQAKQVFLATINVDETGASRVAIQTKSDSYYALDGRQVLSRMETPAEGPIARQIIEKFPEALVRSQKVTLGADDPAGPLGITVELDVPAGLLSDDFLYLQPVIIPVLNDELDDVEQRLYPIDFPYPWQLQYIANVKVPEGYVVEELPPSIRLVSQDGGMQATFSASEGLGGEISIVFRVHLDQTVYPATAYPVLRDMYRRIIELQETTIVCRRAK